VKKPRHAPKPAPLPKAKPMAVPKGKLSAPQKVAETVVKRAKVGGV
jgi:hypothetical protein